MNFWDKYFALETSTEKIDFLLETIDDLTEAQNFVEIEELIKTANEDSRLEVSDMVWVLSFTLWDKSVVSNVLGGIASGQMPKLCRKEYKNRKELFQKCRTKASETRSPQEVEDLLRNLE